MRASGRTSVEGLDGSEQGANQPVPVSWLKLGPEPGRLAEHRLQIQRIGKEKAGGPGGDGGGGKAIYGPGRKPRRWSCSTSSILSSPTPPNQIANS